MLTETIIDNLQQAILHKDLLLVRPKKKFSSIKSLGVRTQTESTLEPAKHSAIDDTPLNHLTYQKSDQSIKKTFIKRPNFTDWKMPPPPQQYLKSKNNDPL
jgi:hypothetical protein